jgi:hypothetical protein
MNREVCLLLGLGLVLPGLLSAGVDTAWVRRYDGPAHGDDWATRLAVDSAGNVYVTGASMSDTGSNTQYLDFVTIKYQPNGDTAWVRRADFGGKDLPSGLGVDAQGNVYVTGTNRDSRMVTVKYSPTGNRLWYEFFGSQGGAYDLALDSQGNVIVCGSSHRASSDAAVVKYRPNGDTAWARFYDWAGHDDELDALALTSGGDICAVGFCSDTVPGGNILVLKYDSTGNRQWASYYDGPQHGADWPSAIAADRFGNSYVAGISDMGYGTPWDYLTIKYGSAGETLWTRRFNGSANGDDEAKDVALDSIGSAIVTGYAQFEAGNSDYATIKYDSAGTQVWVVRYDGPASALDQAFAIAVDALGNAFVTGGARVQQYVAACVTIKYNADGDTVWVATYSAPPFTPVYGTATAVNDMGCVFVAGVYDDDFLTIKYVQDGGVVEGSQTPVVLRPSLSAEPSVLSRSTVVRFRAGRAATAWVSVFDAGGRRVRTLVSGPVVPGLISVTWDGCDERGMRLSSGVYVVILEAGGQRAKVKVVMSE